MGRNGNDKEILEPLAEDPRHYDSATGNPKEDGYVRLGRRPRVAGFDECVSVENADRIEEVFEDMPSVGMTRPY